MWKTTVKGILARKVRFLLTGVAVMLGVAFVSGTLVLTATISKTFDNLFSTIYQNTDAVVREKAAFSGSFNAGRGRVDASVLPVVQRAHGVAAADGSVQGIAVIINKNDKALGSNGRGAPTLGFAYIPDRALSVFHVVEGHGPRAPNQIVIDKKSADTAHYKPGDTVPVVTKAGRQDYELTGIVKFGATNSLLGATAVSFTPATAGNVLGEPGKYDQITVRAAAGVSQSTVARSIRTALRADPAQKNVEVLTGAQITKETQNNLKNGLSFFNTFLLIFGVVALLVGSFIIFNTFSIVVAQRTRELALLRALGAARRQVLGSVVFEALLVGVISSVVGFVGGVFLASGLKALLSALGIDIPASSIVIPASAVIWAFVTGVVVTTVASVAPALRASRIAPIAALREASGDTSGTSLRRIIIGSVVTVLGAVVLGSGLSGGGIQAVGIGAVIVFFGVAILGPVIARPAAAVLGAPIQAIKGVTGVLARENASRNPKRTSATAAALMIGVALVGFITIFGASARTSVNAAIDKSMKADFVINSGQFNQGGYPLTLEQQLHSIPAVTLVSGVRQGAAKIHGGVVNVLAVDPSTVGSAFDLEVSKGSLGTLGSDGLAVLKSTASDNHWHVGSRADVKFPASGPTALPFTVRAIYDQAGLGVDYVTSHQAFARNYPDQFDAQVYVKTAGGPTAANRAAIGKVLKNYPGGKLQDRSQFKAAQAQQINQFLNLVYAMLLFAIVIALFGIANTLGLSIIERTREIGLLRAVGMTRRQVRSTVRWESVIIALLGTVLGLLIGVVFAWAAVTATKDQGIDKFSLAPIQLIVIVVFAAIFGVIAAALPARRAARLDVLRAIETD